MELCEAFHAECPETRKMIHTLELNFEVFPYVCMWKPCICNVSRPLYVSVRYLENSSIWLAEYGPGYSVWFLDIFFLLSVSVLSQKREKSVRGPGIQIKSCDKHRRDVLTKA